MVPATAIEQSGEFFGLMRVRCLHMNDAHIYCSKEDFAKGIPGCQ